MDHISGGRWTSSGRAVRHGVLERTGGRLVWAGYEGIPVPLVRRCLTGCRNGETSVCFRGAYVTFFSTGLPLCFPENKTYPR